MINSKKIDDPELESVMDEMSKGTWKPSLSYRWVSWYQWTWMGKLWFSIKRGIPALWRWKKVAWNDVDWDHSSIYNVLRFKIENIANYIEEHDRFVGAKEEVEWMRKCVRLIDKVSDSEYETEYLDYKQTEWRFEDLEDGTGSSEMHIDTVSENLDDYLNKYPLCKKRAIQYIKDNQHRYCKDHNDKGMVAMIMGQLRQAKAKKLLFDIIEWRIERWWD
jgi:hypothetical protein